jgi:hypothetical protein
MCSKKHFKGESASNRKEHTMKKADEVMLYIAIACTLVCLGTIGLVLALGWPNPGKLRDCVLGIVLFAGGLPLSLVGAVIDSFWDKRFGHLGNPTKLISHPASFFWSQVPNAISVIGFFAAFGGVLLLGYAGYCFVVGR